MSFQSTNFYDLREWIRTQAQELGFADLRIADLDMTNVAPKLMAWLAKGHHGDMNYMSHHADLRIHPDKLQEGAIRAICVRMDYAAFEPEQADWQHQELKRLEDPEQAVVAIYARGRDYHKVLRQRLQTLSERIALKIGDFGYRVFVDSAPVMEVELAQKSGLAWRGKHTLALNREGGSYFFLGEILVDIPLPVDEPIPAHCGQCQACITSCPTGAILGPYELDARRCISYLTIEHAGSIDPELRALMGNRIYGCDDCQLVCPWNKFAQVATIADFSPRHHLDRAKLLELFAWNEQDFLERHAGSPIRRIGYERWSRNIAIALGNSLAALEPTQPLALQIKAALQARLPSASALVAEHIEWALKQLPLNSLQSKHD